MLSQQHAKEITINALPIPFEIVDIVKSFVFYDMKSASIIKETKKHKKLTNRKIMEATFSNRKKTEEREYLEMDPDNMIFNDNSWRFGYLYHSTEDIQIQGTNCAICGNYECQIYPASIRCHC